MEEGERVTECGQTSIRAWAEGNWTPIRQATRFTELQSWVAVVTAPVGPHSIAPSQGQPGLGC
jgi:hypothetical protein